MGKYVSKYLTEGHQIEIAIIILFLFITVFGLLMYTVYKAPKDYFKAESELPLDDYTENLKK